MRDDCIFVQHGIFPLILAYVAYDMPFEKGIMR